MGNVATIQFHGPWFNLELGLFSVFHMFSSPLVVNEGTDVWIHGVLPWPGVPFRVTSCLSPSVSRIGSGFTMTK